MFYSNIIREQSRQCSGGTYLVHTLKTYTQNPWLSYNNKHKYILINNSISFIYEQSVAVAAPPHKKRIQCSLNDSCGLIKTQINSSLLEFLVMYNCVRPRCFTMIYVINCNFLIVSRTRLLLLYTLRIHLHKAKLILCVLHTHIHK